MKNLENLPQHCGLAKDTLVFNSSKNGYDYWDYFDRRWYHFRKVRSYIDRFWKKHIGDDYDTCYRLLVKNIWKKFHLDDCGGYLDVSLKSVNDVNLRYEHYGVDNDGKVILTYNKKSEKKKITIENSELVSVKVDTSKFTKDEINFIIKKVGKDTYYQMCDEIITKERFEKIKSTLKTYWWTNSPNINLTGLGYYKGEDIELLKGTDEYSRLLAERNDYTKKVCRENKKKRKKKLETLIADVEKERIN